MLGKVIKSFHKLSTHRKGPKPKGHKYPSRGKDILRENSIKFKPAKL